MFTFHKPKVFRSANGCCICRAKSSSSRFTDSKRYEAYFEKCFSLVEHRSGEICNACVLLVKRYIKLPAGSTRHWNHVVDARSGPGIKSMVKSKKQQKDSQTSTTKDENQTNETPEKINKKHFYRSKRKPPMKIVRKRNPSIQMSGWLDESIWIKEKVCCGIIFRGPNDMIAIDPKFLHPASCTTCPRSKVIKKEPLTPLPSSNNNNNDTSSRSKQTADDDLEEMETDDSSAHSDEVASPLSSLVAAASSKLIDEADDEGFSEKAVLSPSASSCSGTCTPPPCPSSDPESFLTQQLLNAT